MTRSVKGTAWGVTIGFLGVGLSAFLLLAVGSRLLGAIRFSDLGLAWTWATLFGVGLAVPTEQVITRRLSAGVGHDLRQPVKWLAGGTALAWLVALELAFATSGHRLLYGSLLLVLPGWSLTAWVRGRLAGAGELGGYSIVLIMEATTRLLLIGLALVIKSAASPLLAAAVGGPLLLSALATLVRRPRRPARAAAPSAATEVSGVEHASFVLYSVGYQALLNAAPLLLQWRVGSSDKAYVGAFVIANTYFRIPVMLVGGQLTHALITLSAAWGANDRAGFAAQARRSIRGITGLVAVAALGIAVLSPWALPWYYGRPLGLPVAVLAALALSTVVVVGAAAAGQPLLASGSSAAGAAIWFVGAALTLGGIAILGVSSWALGGALLFGPVLTLGLMIRFGPYRGSASRLESS